MKLLYPPATLGMCTAVPILQVRQLKQELKVLPKGHVMQLVQWQNEGNLASKVTLLAILHGLSHGSKHSGFGSCLMTGTCLQQQVVLLLYHIV